MFNINQSHHLLKQIKSLDSNENFELNVFMMETRVAHKPQNFNYEIMRELDQKIKKWEKWVYTKID